MCQLSADEDREISDEVIHNPIKVHRSANRYCEYLKRKRATISPFKST